MMSYIRLSILVLRRQISKQRPTASSLSRFKPFGLFHVLLFNPSWVYVTDRSNYYFGKNNCMRWAKQPSSRSRNPAYNIISIPVAKPKGPASTLGPEISLMYVFDLFINEHIFETIVLHTNAKIEEVQLRYRICKRTHLFRTIWKKLLKNYELL